MEQPFVVGKPVTGKYFIDREKELKRLSAILSGTSKGDINNVILLGLRRTGKSSILLNIKDKFSKNKKIIPVIFDAYGISTKERFSRSFINKVLDSYVEETGNKAYKEKIKKLLSQKYDKIKNKLSNFDIVVSEFVTFHTKFRETIANEDELLEDALQYPEKLGNNKKITFVIMIDEFQELLKWGDEFLKMFRRLVQSQSHIAYVLSGSAPTVMKEMVYDSKSPFYKQLIEVHVTPLTEESVYSFIKNRLKTVKISIDNTSLQRIFELSRGFPDYVQRLGLQIYLNCFEKNKKSVKNDDVEKAYSEMIIQLDPDFNNIFKTFSDLEKEILIALSNNIESPSAIASEIRKPQSSLPKTLTRLINQDIVEKYREGKYRMMDAIFSDWLGRRFTNITT